MEETPLQPQTEPTVEEVDRENDTFLFNIDLDNSILDDSVKDLDGLEQSISEADHLQDTEAEYADPSPVGDSLDTKGLDIPRCKDLLIETDWSRNMKKNETRIVVPEVRRDRILKAAHSSKMAGHYSRNKTENLLC